MAFTAAAAVIVLLRPSHERWTRVWVFLAPAAVFGAWWFLWRAPSAPSPFPTQPSDVFLFVRESWVMLTAAVTGLSGVLHAPAFRSPVAQVAGALLFLVLIVAGAWRFRRLPPTFWAVLGALLVLLVSTRLSPGGFLRTPDAPRYLYPEAILFLLVLVELAGAVQFRGWPAWVATVVLVLGLWSNIHQLQAAGHTIRQASDVAQGDFTAYEMAGPRLHRNYSPSDLYPTAGQYLDAAAAFGSAAISPPELPATPLAERQAADSALAGTLGIRVRPAHGRPASHAAPQVVRLLSGRTARRHGCVVLEPAPAGGQSTPPSVPLNPSPDLLARALSGRSAKPGRMAPELAELAPPPRGLRLYAADMSKTAVLLGRFAQPPSAQLDRPQQGRAAILRFPHDGIPLPWHVTVASNGPVTACGIGPP
jgi:hypothetical protein